MNASWNEITIENAIMLPKLDVEQRICNGYNITGYYWFVDQLIGYNFQNNQNKASKSITL